MKKFLALPGHFDSYEHDTLEDARSSAKLVALSSDRAIVCEVHYEYARSEDVTETEVVPDVLPNGQADSVSA